MKKTRKERERERVAEFRDEPTGSSMVQILSVCVCVCPCGSAFYFCLFVFASSTKKKYSWKVLPARRFGNFVVVVEAEVLFLFFYHFFSPPLVHFYSPSLISVWKRTPKTKRRKSVLFGQAYLSVYSFDHFRIW